jgi:hypothetical protein
VNFRKRSTKHSSYSMDDFSCDVFFMDTALVSIVRSLLDGFVAKSMYHLDAQVITLVNLL